MRQKWEASRKSPRNSPLVCTKSFSLSYPCVFLCSIQFSCLFLLSPLFLFSVPCLFVLLIFSIFLLSEILATGTQSGGSLENSFRTSSIENQEIMHAPPPFGLQGPGDQRGGAWSFDFSIEYFPIRGSQGLRKIRKRSENQRGTCIIITTTTIIITTTITTITTIIINNNNYIYIYI